MDPETGDVLPDGGTGEIVFTTLTRRGMPLIRYRTGDLGRFLTAPCPCGSVLRRLARVRTRIDGHIALGRDLRISLADLDEAVFSIPWVVNFQADVTGDSGMAVLRLSCRVNSRAPAASEDAVKTVVQQIATVAEAWRRNCLKLAVTCSDGPGLPVSNGTGKRVLADNRKIEHEGATLL